MQFNIFGVSYYKVIKIWRSIVVLFYCVSWISKLRCSICWVVYAFHFYIRVFFGHHPLFIMCPEPLVCCVELDLIPNKIKIIVSLWLLLLKWVSFDTELCRSLRISFPLWVSQEWDLSFSLSRVLKTAEHMRYNIWSYSSIFLNNVLSSGCGSVICWGAL